MQASSFLEGGFSQVGYEATGGRAMAGLLRGPRGHPGVGWLCGRERTNVRLSRPSDWSSFEVVPPSTHLILGASAGK